MHAFSQERKEDPRKYCRINISYFIPDSFPSTCIPAPHPLLPTNQDLETQKGENTDFGVKLAFKILTVIVYQLCDPEQVPSPLSPLVFCKMRISILLCTVSKVLEK